jgi:hypothetical protein
LIIVNKGIKMPLQATSGAASYDGFGGGVPFEPTYIEQVFATHLYTGNSSTQTITNGIDLSTKGGLVWVKRRSAAGNNILADTNRGASAWLSSNLTNGQGSDSTKINSFTSSGFVVGSDSTTGSADNNYASWTFRKQPKFFDIVTWTGNGSNPRNISHNLGSTPGCIIAKNYSGGDSWYVYHRSISANRFLAINSTDEAITFNTVWANTTPTSTQFTVGATLNSNGTTYVAYLFAHDAGGFGLTGTDNVISCGSYTTTGADQEINLGWEPQWVLTKNTDISGNAFTGWGIFDSMRGFTVNADNPLLANRANAENGTENSNSNNYIDPTATGFRVKSGTTLAGAGTAGYTYIYIAIRRGPMKTPTTGTSVFSPNIISSPAAVTTNFPVDLSVARYSRTTAENTFAIDRLRGLSSTSSTTQPWVITNGTNAENSSTLSQNFFNNTGFSVTGSANNGPFWSFRRAPGFFDVVCYTGTGSARTLSHNLTVAPELMILKARSEAEDWSVFYNFGASSATGLVLQSTAASFGVTYASNGTLNGQPTASSFFLGSNTGVNKNTITYVAYLFASVAGVSKVFSFTGNGSSQTINCGFTGGARFVMIKRTDSTGDWYVWDSARGIVSGNDPRLSLNTTAAEVTTDDSVDTDSTGFVVNQLSATNVNVNGATYIGLAIA